MTPDDLSARYRDYIDVLNRQDWDRLNQHVAASVCHNGRQIGLEGYRAMLEGDFQAIPDLRFEIALMVAQPPRIASRLSFDCTPLGTLVRPAGSWAARAILRKRVLHL